MSNELKPLTTTSKSYAEESEQFVDSLKDIKVEKEEKLICFFIADMYPSLSKMEVMNEVGRKIQEHTFRTKVDKFAPIRLAKMSVEFISFKIKNTFYNQANGLFIALPASPCFDKIEWNLVSTQCYRRKL